MIRGARKKNGPLIVGVGVVVGGIIAAILYFGFSIGTSQSSPPINPFGPGEGPPQIVMMYDGTEYEGELLGYVFNEREAFENIPPANLRNITAIPEVTEPVIVSSGASVEFRVKGNDPPESTFDSLSATLYDTEGEVSPELVRSTFGSRTAAYTLDSNLAGEEEYVIAATATWLPDDQRQVTSGYVAYGFTLTIEQ